MNRPSCGTHLWMVSGFLLFCAGCGDPIYDSVSFDPSPATYALELGPDESRYEWPIQGKKYVITKPPPMAYLTSFDEKVSFDNEFDAELVPWDDLALGEQAEAYLDEVFSPLPSPTMGDPLLMVEPGAIVGPVSFDLSSDGERLVLLEGTALVLYKVESGKRVGSMPLPGDWSGGAPEAVRFCGRSNDFLVASPEQICRISGKDGSVVRRIDGCRAPLKKWVINHRDDSMLVLTEEGKLYAGDTRLKIFSPSDVGGTTFDDVSLSENGERILAVSGLTPMFFYQQNHRVVRQDDIGEIECEGRTTAIAGLNTDAWVDSFDMLALLGNANDDSDNRLKLKAIQMYWRPHLGVCCSDDEKTNWFLLAGERVVENRRQWILFDFGARSRNHSVAVELNELPERLMADRAGTVVALLDSSGLHVHRRESFRSSERILTDDHAVAMLNQASLEQVEKLYEAIGRQKRWSAGKCPSEIQSELLQTVANRWNALERDSETLDDPQRATLRRIRQWHEAGGIIAKTVSAYRHTRLAWRSRGSGYNVSAKGWEGFQAEKKLAIEELESIIEERDVPALALGELITLRLHDGAGFAATDPLVRRAVELYPGNLDIAYAVGFMLLPQWRGTAGDIASFALAHSKLYGGKFADIAYGRLIGSLSRYIANEAAADWRSVRIHRAAQGVEYRRQMRWPVRFNDWYLKETVQRVGGKKESEQILRYFMAELAALPEPNANPFWYTPDILKLPEQIFSKTSHQTTSGEKSNE